MSKQREPWEFYPPAFAQVMTWLWTLMGVLELLEWWASR